MLAGVNKKLKVGEALITQQQLPLRFFYVPRVVVLIPLIVFSLMIVHTLFSLLFPSLYLNLADEARPTQIFSWNKARSPS